MKRVTVNYIATSEPMRADVEGVALIPGWIQIAHSVADHGPMTFIPAEHVAWVHVAPIAPPPPAEQPKPAPSE